MLSVDTLTCGYNGNTVLSDVSFTAEPNKKLFIIGPNGCGKTTLLRAIAGLIPYRGTICIHGHDASLLSKKERSQKIALMSQMSEIYFSYSVLETVMQGRYAHLKNTFFKSETRADKEIVLACLKATDLTALKDKSIRQLSGGQLQRVFLARALAQEPQIILLDEPTNHLDFRFQLELMDYLDQWVHLSDRIVIGVMHDINLALSCADQLLALKGGVVFAQDNSSTLNLDLVNEVFDTNVRGYMLQSLQKWER